MEMKRWVVLIGVCLFLVSLLFLPPTSNAGVDDVKKILSKRVVPDEVVVKIEKWMTKNEVSAVARNMGGKVVGAIERRNLYLVKVPNAGGKAAAVSSLKRHPAVREAFENILFEIPENFQISKPVKSGETQPTEPEKPDPYTGSRSKEPFALHLTNDPLLGYQWYMTKIHEVVTSSGLGTAPLVAVIDTGVYPDTNELYDRVIMGFDFVDWDDWPYDCHGHGTHVAGIIAAKASNNMGIHGVCPNCKVLAVRVLDCKGSGSWFGVMAGIDYADHQIDTLGGAAGTKGIINMSLGGYADPNDPAYVEMKALIADVAANNKLIVVAAGNDNDETYTYCQSYPDSTECGGYLRPIPASMQPYVLSVAASDPNDFRASFSNTNTLYTNVVAPGRFILSTVFDHYEAWDGTSMATPIVAGEAGRRWAQVPTSTAAQVRSKILTTGQILPSVKGWPGTLRRLDLAHATATSVTGFSGYVVNPEVGDWNGGESGLFQPINRVTVKVKSGTTVVKTTKTNESGFFIVTGLSPNTTYTLEFSKLGYRTITRTETTLNGLIKDVPYASRMPIFMPIVRTPVAPFEEYLLTLEWTSVEPYSALCGLELADCTDPALGNRGSELDFYLRRPNGSIVYYGNIGDQYGMLTRDSYDDYMPGEGLYIKNLMTGGTGKYTVAVKRFSWGRMTGVGAIVRLYKGSTLTNTWNVPSACGNAATDTWWVVAEISSTGTVTTKGICQDSAPF